MKTETQLAVLNLKIEWMSSKEVSGLTDKRHDNVLRDIRGMLDELGQSSVLSSKQYHIVTAENGMTKEIMLDKELTLTLVSGYSHTLRNLVIRRWQYLEEQLHNFKYRKDDKKLQLAAMEALHDMLPEDIQAEAINYIKANTIVNKAVSNLFGFPKMLKKDDMNRDMLEARNKVMDDYLKLFEVLEDNGKVKEIMYAKYQPKRLEQC